MERNPDSKIYINSKEQREQSGKNRNTDLRSEERDENMRFRGRAQESNDKSRVAEDRTGNERNDGFPYNRK